jgi:uncharacterized protein
MERPDPAAADAGLPEDTEPVEVPPEMLAEGTLRSVVESFVLREGTDYGEREVDFETKVAQVMAHLRAGRAQLLFDPATDSVTLRLKP